MTKQEKEINGIAQAREYFVAPRSVKSAEDLAELGSEAIKVMAQIYTSGGDLDKMDKKTSKWLLDSEGKSDGLTEVIRAMLFNEAGTRRFDHKFMGQIHPQGNKVGILGNLIAAYMNTNTIVKEVSMAENMMEVLKERGLFSLGDIFGVGPDWSGKVSRVLFEFGCEDLRDLHYKFGSGALTPVRLAGFLDEIGIDKESLGLVSVSLSGSNRQGLLAEVTEMITSIGGDIVNLKLVWEDEDKYRLRFVVDGLSDRESELLSLLAEGGGLEEIQVV